MLAALRHSFARLLTPLLVATVTAGAISVGAPTSVVADAATATPLTADALAAAAIADDPVAGIEVGAVSLGPMASGNGVCIGQSPPRELWVTSTTRSSIYRLYCGAFLRLPDTNGLDYWTGERLSRRLDIAAIAQAFVTSPEFVQRYGNVDDRGFLDLVYRNVLGRPSDEAGYRYWAEHLQRHDFDRGDLLISFSESAEFMAATNTSGAVAAGDRSFLQGGLSARAAADVDLARGTFVATQCWPDQFGGNVRWVRGTWDLTWCVRTDPNWPTWVSDAVYVHEAFHVRVSLLYHHRAALTPEQRAEVERVVGDKAANEGLADLWTMRLVPGYEGAPQYAPHLFTNAIWEDLFTRYPLGGALPG